jgi:hypothetical protein
LAGDARDVDACGGLCLGAVIGAGAITNLAIDYLNEYKKTDKKTIKEYWESGEYPETRGAVQFAVGGAGAAVGGAIGVLEAGVITKFGLGMAYGGVSTFATNILLVEDDSLGIGVLAGGGGILLGETSGKLVSKSLKVLRIPETKIRPLGKTMKYGMEMTRQENTVPYAVGNIISSAGTDAANDQLKKKMGSPK